MKRVIAFLAIVVIITFVVIGYKFYNNNETNITEEVSIKSSKSLNENKVIENIIEEEKINPTEVPKEKVSTVKKQKVDEKENEKTNTTYTGNIISEENKENHAGKIIVIDPGHQAKGDSSKEPIGPGASETKTKVTTGATGISTKQTEAELNLKVGLMLRDELQKRGYTVLMTRTTNNVNISNSERAKIANDANADAFVRIHADSYENQSVQGTSALCQTSKNKYNGNLADKSYSLSKKIVDNITKITGSKNRGVTRTDTMSGINWSKVPVAIVEMGFLSNKKEDELLSTTEYQKKIVQGIANGIDEFLK